MLEHDSLDESIPGPETVGITEIKSQPNCFLYA